MAKIKMSQKEYQRRYDAYMNAPVDPNMARAFSGLFAPPEPEAPEGRGLLRAVADTGVSLGQGLTGVVKAGSDLFGADNPASEFLGGINDGLQGLYSPSQQQKLKAHRDAIEAAELTGDRRNEIGAWWDAISSDPVHYFAQVAGSAGPFAALRGISAASKVAGMSTRGAAQVGLGGGVGMGAVKGAQYEAVYNEAKARGYSDQDAEALAVDAQSYSRDNAVDL
jgi:hypothetical protein